jgi:hypothetical protein
MLLHVSQVHTSSMIILSDNSVHLFPWTEKFQMSVLTLQADTGIKMPNP